jgi:hypothetical protein
MPVLPLTVPECSLEEAAITPHSKYGLLSITPASKQARQVAMVAGDLRQLERWSRAPVQLNRPEALGAALAASTWDNTKSSIHLYLGYCYHHQQVSGTVLELYTDAQLFVAFASFLMARDVGKEHLLKQIEVANRVLWWLELVKLGQQHNVRLERLRAWLATLRLQLGRNYVPIDKPSREPADLQLLGKWMEAPVLAAKVEAVRQRALAALATLPESYQQRRAAAELVHNAALAMMLFGYIPPLRPSCIISTTLPSYQGQCQHPDCQHRRHCRGNRFERQGSKLLLVLPHHKNTKHWGGAAIRVALPQPLVQVLLAWFDWGHAVATQCDEEQPFAFISLATGLQLKPEAMAKTWAGIVLEGTGFHFGPQRCRSIFVQERRLRLGERAPGPSDAAAAMIMGHSLTAWDRHYDRQFCSTAAQEAVDTMDSWREAMLQRAAADAEEEEEEEGQHNEQQQVNKGRLDRSRCHVCSA